MCLDTNLSEQKEKEIIKQAKRRGYIRIFKVCKFERTGTFFNGNHCKYKSGLQKAKSLNFGGGWYGFLTLQGAKRYKYENEYIKVCYAKPQWIIKLGKIDWDKAGSAGRFTHLVFPDWDRGDMTIREFRQICKDSKNKN